MTLARTNNFVITENPRSIESICMEHINYILTYIDHFITATFFLVSVSAIIIHEI